MATPAGVTVRGGEVERADRQVNEPTDGSAGRGRHAKVGVELLQALTLTLTLTLS